MYFEQISVLKMSVSYIKGIEKQKLVVKHNRGICSGYFSKIIAKAKKKLLFLIETPLLINFLLLHGKLPCIFGERYE